MLVKRKSGLGLVIKSVAAIALIGAASYGFYVAPFLRIEGLEIMGSGITEDEIHSLLGESIRGANILLWQPPNNLDSLGLSRFAVEKNYISRTLTVYVEPRDKKFVWCYGGSEHCFWVDSAGTLFAPSPKLSGNLLYTILDKNGIPVELGSKVLPEKLLNNLISILVVLERINLPISEIYIDNIKTRELIVLPIGGPKIVFSLDINPDFTEAAIDAFKKGGWSAIKEINLTVYERGYASF